MVCSGLIERLNKLLLGCPFTKDCEFYTSGPDFECDDNNHTRCGQFKTRVNGPARFLVKMTIPKKPGERETWIKEN